LVEELKAFDPPQANSFPNWDEEAYEAPIDKEYLLNARRGGQFGIEWTINGKAYPDYDPFSLNYGVFNKIRLTNQSARLHPMHLHGQFFQVIARNGQPVDEPYWRDTVLVHSRETIDIAMVPLDKGKWANHCHILEHAEAGMMTVVEVK
jgi:FtsP/CotA-like multicopper oxidase with cupredoxin domain